MKFKPIYVVYLCLVGLSFIALMITGDIRSRSERQLISEDKATAAGNRQKLAEKEALADYEKEREDAAKERQFNRTLYGSDTPPPEVVQQQIEEHLKKLEQSASKTP